MSLLFRASVWMAPLFVAMACGGADERSASNSGDSPALGRAVNPLVWSDFTPLVASDWEEGDGFGVGVAIAGDVALVAAQLEDGLGGERGAVYVFQRDEGGENGWGEQRKLTASDADEGDRFGASLAISSELAIVAADQEGAQGAAYIGWRGVQCAGCRSRRHRLRPPTDGD